MKYLIAVCLKSDIGNPVAEISIDKETYDRLMAAITSDAEHKDLNMLDNRFRIFVEEDNYYG